MRSLESPRRAEAGVIADTVPLFPFAALIGFFGGWLGWYLATLTLEETASPWWFPALAVGVGAGLAATVHDRRQGVRARTRHQDQIDGRRPAHGLAACIRDGRADRRRLLAR